jgi:hypothetical protein
VTKVGYTALSIGGMMSKSIFRAVKNYLATVPTLKPSEVTVGDIITKKVHLMTAGPQKFYSILETKKIEYRSTYDDVFVVRELSDNKITEIPHSDIKTFVKTEVAEKVNSIINGDKNV